ncbi:hypothetical protein BKA70DRAFT_1409338 [Coprinopsis sp. MPI-PUGE-AT-0042]|nr:hypothetical protein BKA70DRAFT_1409338 [Coprinopsis sp. MPI-PUGE-AT-0042]
MGDVSKKRKRCNFAVGRQRYLRKHGRNGIRRGQGQRQPGMVETSSTNATWVDDLEAVIGQTSTRDVVQYRTSRSRPPRILVPPDDISVPMVNVSAPVVGIGNPGRTHRRTTHSVVGWWKSGHAGGNSQPMKLGSKFTAAQGRKKSQQDIKLYQRTRQDLSKWEVLGANEPASARVSPCQAAIEGAVNEATTRHRTWVTTRQASSDAQRGVGWSDLGTEEASESQKRKQIQVLAEKALARGSREWEARMTSFGAVELDSCPGSARMGDRTPTNTELDIVQLPPSDQVARYSYFLQCSW